MQGIRIALLVGVWFGAGRLAAAETQVRGQPLAYWMDRLKEGETLQRQDAAEAIGRFGPDGAAAIPLLAEALRDRRLERPAIHALARIGPKAMPILVACLVDHKGHDTDHVGALAGAGAPAVPALRRALRHRDLRVRLLAARALERMGQRGRAAIPELARALQNRRPRWCIPAVTLAAPGPGMPGVTFRHVRVVDQDKDSAAAAGSALASMGTHAVPALVDVLRDRRSPRRFHYLTGLLWPTRPVGNHAARWPGGQELLLSAALLPGDAPRLVESFWSAEATSRREAAVALGRIGPAARAAVPALTEALRDEDQPTRIEAARALGAIGPAAQTAASSLRALLADKRLADRSNTLLSALLALGPAAEKEWVRQAVPILAARLKANDPAIRKAACQAIQVLGPRGRAALPAFGAALDRTEDSEELLLLSRVARALDPDVTLRFLLRRRERPGEHSLGLVYALGDFGARGRAAILMLRRLAEHSEQDVRIYALVALLRVETRPEVRLPILFNLLRESGTDAREVAPLLPIFLDRKAKAAIPKLQALLVDREPSITIASAWTLLQLGAPLREPLARLRTLLASKDRETLIEAHFILRALGSQIRPLVPLLVKQLRGDPEARLQAAWTLSKMSPEQARLAEPTLLGLFREEEPYQVEVVQVLANLEKAPPAAAVPLANLLLHPDLESADITFWAILNLLKRMGPDAVPALPALWAVALSEKNDHRYTAVCLLGWLRAKMTVPTLMELLHHSDPQYRAAAAAALGRMGRAGWQAAHRLGGMLDDEDGRVRAAVAGALLEWTGDRREFAPRVAREIRINPDCAFALLTAGTASDVAMSALRAALKDPHPEIQSKAVEQLGQQGPAGQAAASDLVALLGDTSAPEIREEVAQVLAYMGPAARTIVPELRRLIRDGDMGACLHAAYVLGRIADGSEP